MNSPPQFFDGAKWEIIRTEIKKKIERVK